MEPVPSVVARLFPEPDPLLIAAVEEVGATPDEVADAVGCLLDEEARRAPSTDGARKVHGLLADALTDEEDTETDALGATG